MSWATLIKYGLPAVAIIGLLLAIDDNGYARGRDAANAACVETVKAAKKEVKDQCDLTTKQGKDLSHALRTDVDNLTASYVSLLKAKCGASGTIHGAAGGNDGPARADQSAWVLTLDQRYLNDKQAAQLVSCQNTVAAVYCANGRQDLLPPLYQAQCPTSGR